MSDQVEHGHDQIVWSVVLKGKTKGHIVGKDEDKAYQQAQVLFGQGSELVDSGRRKPCCAACPKKP